MAARLITEWSTETGGPLAEVLKRIADERDPVVRMEMEAALHTWQALDCARQAERMRVHRKRRRN